MKKINLIAVVVLGILIVPFVVWNVLFGLIVAIPLVALLLFGYWRVIKHQNFKWVYYSVAIGFVIYLLALPVTTRQINHKQHNYYSIIKNGGELNNLQMVNMYGYHAVMTTMAAPFFPEAARATFTMMFPHKWDTERHGNDFFKKSDKLMAVLSKAEGKGHFNWKLEDYNIFSDEVRVATAMNPVDYEVIRTNNTVEYRLEVPLHYHVGLDVFFKSKLVTIQIQEDVLWYMARRGWLHEGVLTWVYKESV